MAKAQFEFKIVDADGYPAILIKDLGKKGSMTVTNDIENVVAYIAGLHKLQPSDYIIVYCDSQGVWDGYDPKTEKIILLGMSSFEHAIQEYIRQQVTDNSKVFI